MLFLLCSDPDHAAVTEQAAACAAQDFSPVRVAIPGSGDESAGVQRLADEAALRAAIAQARLVVLLSPGQRPEPTLAEALVGGPPDADVLYCEAAMLRPFDGLGGADIVHAVRLGARLDGGFAIRGAALEAFEGSLVERLSGDGPAVVGRWAAHQPGLRWARLPATLLQSRTSLLSRGPAAAPPQPGPRRLTLAIWDGWDDEAPPPAVSAWLAQAGGFEVEVLTPADRAAASEERIRSTLPKDAPRALSFRGVDDFDAAASGRCGRLAAAASGQVVVLSCGALADLTPGALADLAGWAWADDVGVVTLPVKGPDGAVLAGLCVQDPGSGGFVAVSAYDATLADTARPVLAAPLICMAVARPGLDMAGGFDPRLAGPSAAVDLALRLRDLGRASLLLGQHAADAPAGAMADWRLAPISPVAQAARHTALLAALADYPPPFPLRAGDRGSARAAS